MAVFKKLFFLTYSTAKNFCNLERN